VFLEELLAWMRKYGDRSTQVIADAEGAAINKRLQELLDLEADPAHTLDRSRLSAPSKDAAASTGVSNRVELRAHASRRTNKPQASPAFIAARS
jgi:hypothetical protein